MDQRTSTSSTTMASAMGLVLNQVGTHDPTYLSLVKVCLLAVLSSLIKNPFDQKTVNDSISKKFHANDRVLESLSHQLETLNSAMKNQLSFNKMLETQIAQLATVLPSPTSGKLPGQPEPPLKEHINAVTTRDGRSTQDPPHPRAAGKEQGKRAAPEEEDEVDREPPRVKEAPKSAPHEFYDSTMLPFPQRQKKASVYDQFGKFVEVIKKLYVNIPLLDAMQVPSMLST